MRIAYMFRGQLWYANKSATESPLAAIARGLKRRLNENVTVWYHGCETGHEEWRVQWYDRKSETYQEDILRYSYR
jgi:hypothetical protein